MADTEADTAAVAAAAVPAEPTKTERSEHIANGTTKQKPVKDDDEKNGQANGRSKERDNYGRGRGNRGGRAFQNGHGFKKRITEFENIPETDDPSEIRSQVEFYFSTHNLVTDQHLFMEMQGPKNRPVPIKHLHTFKRMRHFTPYSAIVAALRESLDLIVVDSAIPGNEAVRRKEALVVEAKEGDEENPPSTMDLFSRLKRASSNDLDKCIYVKGFGSEEDAGQITLEQFFRPYGSVMIRKRRDDKNAWKGSIFVEFESKDSQEQFLALDPQPKFKGNELISMGKKEYVEMKCKEKGIKPDWELPAAERDAKDKKRREEEAERRSKGRNRGRDHNQFGGRGRGRGGRGRGRGRGWDRFHSSSFGRGRGRSRSTSSSDRSRSPRRGRDRSRSVSISDRSHSRSRTPRRHRGSDRSRSPSRSRTPPRHRYRNRSRSPRKNRDRSESQDSVDSRDWNTRRDRYLKGKDDRSSRRKEYKKDIKKDIERDAHGVPVVKDTRTKAEMASSKKRKADGEARDDGPKKSKLEIMEDE